MNVLAITQARSGSKRLPNKVLMKIEGKTMLQIHIDRIKLAKSVDEILIATTTNKADIIIEDLANSLDVLCYRGSENDVLDRFYEASKKIKPNFIVRLTSDCPLIDPLLIDEVVTKAIEKKLDYYSNGLIENYPDGQDIEVFTFKALETAWKNAKLPSEREHVTPYIRNNSNFHGGKLFISDNHYPEKNYNNVRLTVDDAKDFEVITKVIKEMGLDKTWQDYSDFYLENKAIKIINNKTTRNEGYLKSINEDDS